MEIVTRRNCRQICTTGRVLHKYAGVPFRLTLCYNTHYIPFAFGRHHDPRCPERLSRSLPRSRCRKRPGKLIAIVNELNRELDEEKKKKAAVFLQKIDKKRA